MQRRLPRLAFVRRAVSRFMPGEQASDALEASHDFQRRGIGTVLTLLGENVRDEAEARQVIRHYSGVMEAIRRAGLDAEVSVKLTHLGLDLGPEVAYSNLRALAEVAASLDKTLWVDMEGSPYTQVTLDLYRRVRAEHRNVGLCLQAYLRRTAQDLESLVPLAASIRLVKGAYAEPRSVAFAGMKEVDDGFFRLAERLLHPAAVASGARIAFGTHDGTLIRRIADAAAARGVAKDSYEFQLLYGIRRDEQDRLAGEGHRVRVLISYGEAWFPWYMRRLAERPANLWFVLKNLLRR
jgi:proline dehydrogenase